MALFAYVYSPTRAGNLAFADRVVHVPSDIRSSGADGEVSRRDPAHPADINPNHAILNDVQIDVLGQPTRPPAQPIPTSR
jgi:hypothetical protein